MHRRLLVTAVLAVLSALPAAAQTLPASLPASVPPVPEGTALSRAVSIGGTSRIRMEAATAARPGQTLPASFARWEFAPTVTAYGIPFGIDLLFTTEASRVGTDVSRLAGGLSLGSDRLRSLARERVQARLERLAADQLSDSLGVLSDSTVAAGLAAVADVRARVDSLALRVADARARIDARRADFAELQALARDPERIPARAMQRLGLLSRAESRALSVPSFGIGVVSPVYARTALWGVTATGAMAEVVAGPFVLAAAGGRVRDPLPGRADILNPAFGTLRSRTLAGGRLGVGRPLGSNLLLHGVLARDAGDGAAVLLDSLGGLARPAQQSVAGGLSGAIAIAGRFRLSGEATGVVFTSDRDGPAFDSTLSAQIPSSLRSLTGANLTSSVDGAGLVRAEWRSPATRFDATAEYVGPGFANLAAPGLRRDRARGGVSGEQRLMRGRLTLSGQAEAERDNLAGTKRATTDSGRYGLGIAASPRGLPSVRVQGLLSTRRTAADSAGAGGFTFSSTVLTAQASHTLRLGALVSSTQLVAVRSDFRSEAGAPGTLFLADGATTTVSLTETLLRGSLSGSLGYDLTALSGEPAQHRGRAAVSAVAFRTASGEAVVVGLTGSAERGGLFGSVAELDLSAAAPAGPLGLLDARVGQTWIGAGALSGASSRQTRVAVVLTRSF